MPSPSLVLFVSLWPVRGLSWACCGPLKLLSCVTSPPTFVSLCADWVPVAAVGGPREGAGPRAHRRRGTATHPIKPSLALFLPLTRLPDIINSRYYLAPIIFTTRHTTHALRSATSDYPRTWTGAAGSSSRPSTCTAAPPSGARNASGTARAATGTRTRAQPWTTNTSNCPSAR